MRYNIEIDSENAAKFKDWFKNRGGVLVWENKEIGGSGAREVFTPKLSEDGFRYPQPNWRYAGEPEEVDEISVRVRECTVLRNWHGRTKIFYWGLGLHPSSEAKAERVLAEFKQKSTAKNPDQTLEYRWTPEWGGGCLIEIIEIKRCFLCNWNEPLATTEVK